MPDEQPQNQQNQDAQKKVDVPQGVTTNNGEDIHQILADHAKKSEGKAELFASFGAKNYQQFIDNIKSNPMFAQRLAEMFVNGDEANTVGAAGLILDPQAPQEDNIVGMVDHTSDVATKLHIEGESKAEPVNDNTDGTHSGTVNE